MTKRELAKEKIDHENTLFALKWLALKFKQ